MIRSLYVKNFALIDELKIDWHQGLNIITGETGAGKSIVVGALGALLGDKLNREIVRQGESKGVVEGEFSLAKNPDMQQFFAKQDLDWFGGQVIIRREINHKGRSRCFLNDVPVTVTTLSDFGDLLVDLHGQHDHQQLLRIARHRAYLDEYGHLQTGVEQVSQAYQQWTSLRFSLADLLKKQDDIKRSRELLQFQYQEIMAVDPRPDEEEELESEERILGNAQFLYEQTSSLFKRLYEDEGSVSEILSLACKQLRELADIDPSCRETLEQCENAALIVNDVSTSMQGYTSNITFDAERLEEIRNRMAAINGLKKKYGGTIAAILENKKQLQERLQFSENLDNEIKRLGDQVDDKRKVLKSVSLELSEERRKTGEDLAKKATTGLQNLGMPKSVFIVSNEYKDATGDDTLEIGDRRVAVTSRGIDHIEFLFSANPGETPRPLVKVASGGEISRVMLALKSLLAKVDRVPVLVFDEIDNGVSGRMAQVVGRNLKDLAFDRQVICITHLPQIASQAHHHYLVEKRTEDEHTSTTIRMLDHHERIRQIADLFGGEQVTETHLKSAEEMLQQAISTRGSADR